MENKGKMHIVGLQAYVVHVNYLGVMVWRSALLAYSQVWSLQVWMLLVVAGFVKGSIPRQRKRNLEKYGEEFKRYWDTTPKLVPGVY
jgi:steroid 5-alpha reductase family enzyme